MYIDTALDGHHISYIQELVKSNEDAIAVLPKECLEIPCRQFIVRQTPGKSLLNYLTWIGKVQRIVARENPEVVHFLTGDDFYRYFGLGLSGFRKTKVVMTVHWIRAGFLHRLSLRTFSRFANVVVMHSRYMQKRAEGMGLHNVTTIEYPNFTTLNGDTESFMRAHHLTDGVPIIVCLGNTRFDKGLDILLRALDQVTVPFQLVIAGKPDFFSEEFIRQQTRGYSNQVNLDLLHYLSEEELEDTLGSADFVVLPYRKVFGGASGPLVEGVALGKCIIGPDTGNLRDTIKSNDLGYTFHSEDSDSLAEVLQRALSSDFSPSERYLKYQGLLDPRRFVDNYKKLYREVTDK